MSAPDGLIEYPRFEPRRGGRRASWWAKAWQSAVEEACYSPSDLKHGLKLARAGGVGRIALGVSETGNGVWVAGVEVGDEVLTTTGTVRPLDADASRGLVEVIAAGAGRIGALLAGDLPTDLVADGEEVGVELLPWSGELSFTCTCEPWADPCPHAVATATQVGWLLDQDPLLLIALRGTAREELLTALNNRLNSGSAADEVDPDADDEAYEDLAVAEEAALRMERALADL